MNQELITPTNAIRVWSGFKKSDLEPKDFLRTLGDTFIPGTLYMLRPLGVSSYIPAGLVNQKPIFPDELALIVYRTQDSFKGIMRDSLRGRVYSASHANVFDMSKSKASFPILWEGKDAPNETYYLFEKNVDWQRGTIFLCLFYSLSPDKELFKRTLKNKFTAIGELTSKQGVEQVIFQVRDDFASMWVYTQSDNLATDYQKIITELINSNVQDNIVGIDIILKSESLAVYEKYPDTLIFNNHRLVNYKFLRTKQAYIY
jgi:hypothetical protein